MAEQVFVKTSLRYEEHHVLPLTSQSLDTLKDNIRRSFPLLQQPDIVFKLFWKDKDGDRICLSTDSDLGIALKAAKAGSFQLHFDIVVDVVPTHDLSQSESLSVRTNLELSHDVRGPPTVSQASRIYPIESISRSSYDRSLTRSPLSFGDGMIPESRPQPISSIPESRGQPISSESEVPHCGDVLNITPTTPTPIIKDWPSESSYSLGCISKMKKTLERSTNSQSYPNDPGKKCRVLCILNKTSKGNEVYRLNGIDMETTYLQHLAKRRWDLQMHKNKTKHEMEDILNEEMNKTFDCYSSLMVIIISGGFTTNSRSFIYGTDNSCIDYTLIRTRFEQVESLKGKPKVFIIDDIEYFKDEALPRMNTGITAPKQTIDICTPVLIEQRDQRDCTAVSENHDDTFVCLASTLGRSDKLVKGSWVIGALISILCKEGSKMSFQDMMNEVKLMIDNANLPNPGVPNPEMKVENHLKKAFYLLPPPY